MWHVRVYFYTKFTKYFSNLQIINLKFVSLRSSYKSALSALIISRQKPVNDSVNASSLFVNQYIFTFRYFSQRIFIFFYLKLKKKAIYFYIWQINLRYYVSPTFVNTITLHSTLNSFSINLILKLIDTNLM